MQGFVPDSTQGRSLFVCSGPTSSRGVLWKKKVKELRAAIEQASADVTDKARLSDFWQKYLSKNGEVAGLTKSLRDVPKEDRPAVGKTINEFKQWAEAQYQALSEQVEKAALEARNAAETVDITMPAKIRQTGSLHPITLVKNEIIDVFAGMGFEIYEGPEIEDDDHNFTRLNVPKNHPARDMQDTFYVADDIVLRTQTSGGQIRVMDIGKPPSGRWPRAACSVPTPTRLTPRCSTRWKASSLTRASRSATCRECSTNSSRRCSVQTSRPACVRPTSRSPSRASRSTFPASSAAARAARCASTPAGSRSRAGVVHHSVLENCGIDPNVYSGFAFGIGIERIAMLKYGINNIGLMFENNLQFLKQFHE